MLHCRQHTLSQGAAKQLAQQLASRDMLKFASDANCAYQWCLVCCEGFLCLHSCLTWPASSPLGCRTGCCYWLLKRIFKLCCFCVSYVSLPRPSTLCSATALAGHLLLLLTAAAESAAQAARHSEPLTVQHYVAQYGCLANVTRQT
jgi:hypothetical protein